MEESVLRCLAEQLVLALLLLRDFIAKEVMLHLEVNVTIRQITMIKLDGNPNIICDAFSARIINDILRNSSNKSLFGTV